MKFVVCLGFWAFFFSNSTAQTPLDSLGKIYRFHLKNAPFPDSARQNGFDLNGTHFDAKTTYADPTVIVFVPKDQPFDAKTDFIVHFHDINSSAEGVLKNYNLLEHIDFSGKKPTLILPQGPKNAPDNYWGNLEKTGGFEKMMNEIFDSLGTIGRPTQGARTIVLSAQAEAYRVVAKIMAHGGLDNEIKEAWLFDGLRGELDVFEKFCKTPGRRLINIFTERGETQDQVNAFDRIQHERGTPFYIKTKEETLPKAWPWMPGGRVIQISTPLKRGPMIDESGFFQRLIMGSPLLK